MAIIRRVKIREKKGGSSYKVTVTVGEDENSTVETVDVRIPTVEEQPVANPQTVPTTFEKEEGEDRIFSYNTLTFSENAVGFTYEVTGIMKDQNGKPIGDSLTEPVEIEAYSESESA